MGTKVPQPPCAQPREPKPKPPSAPPAKLPDGLLDCTRPNMAFPDGTQWAADGFVESVEIESGRQEWIDVSTMDKPDQYVPGLREPDCVTATVRFRPTGEPIATGPDKPPPLEPVILREGDGGNKAARMVITKGLHNRWLTIQEARELESIRGTRIIPGDERYAGPWLPARPSKDDWLVVREPSRCWRFICKWWCLGFAIVYALFAWWASVR